MKADRMFELASQLGSAKNSQNITKALTFMHDDIELRSPAWGVIARGKSENSEVLEHFFHDYPDYNVNFDGYVAGESEFVGWGTVRMTMAQKANDAVGMVPNGQRIEIPVTIRMTFKDDLIETEHFLCDLTQIAIQSGVSVDRMVKNIFGGATAST